MPQRLAVREPNYNRPGLRARAKEYCMLIYRFLTGEDDSAFCHKVTKALSEGWVLHGTTAYAYDAVAKRMKAGQAVTKTVPDQPYDPDKKLVDYV